MAIKYPQSHCVRQQLLLTADGQVSPGSANKRFATVLRKGILTGKIGIGQASLFIRRWPAKPDGGYWLGGMTQKNRMKILFLPPF